MDDIARRGPVLWVTNLAAPYRAPLWAALADSFDLRVGLLESTARLARDVAANRGDDWAAAAHTPYLTVEYPTWCLKRGEDRHYVLRTHRAFRDLLESRVVLLGGWDSPAYWQLLVVARLARIATVGFYESTLASQSRNVGQVPRARRLFFRCLDAVIVPGPAARDAVLAMGVDPERISMGFNAVDLAAFGRSFASKPHVGHRFLYVGQLIDRKNVSGIMQAFAGMANDDDRLTLVGRGPLRGRLEGLAVDLGIANQVEFVDYLPNKELPELMSGQDTLVLASDVEVWGLVVNEALATGMQAVVTENCGVAASVHDMPGVFVGPVDQLAQMMTRARQEFGGRIEDPPIRSKTPEAFAGVFARVFQLVMVTGSTRRMPHGRRRHNA